MSGSGSQASAPERPVVAPKYLREFSKEASAEERKILARDIKNKRSDFFARKRQLPEELGAVNKTQEELAVEVEDRQRELAELEETIAGLSASWPLRTLRVMSLRRRRKEFENSETAYKDTLKDLAALKEEEDRLTRELEQKGVDVELGQARDMLRNFYDREQEKWSREPYTVEQMKELLSPDNLSSLSLDEYINLLKRFPSHMVTHVTRQGVRDHIGHGFHGAGYWEYSNGFIDILKKGKIDSAIGVIFKDGMTKEAIIEYLHLERFSTKKDAMKMIDAFVKGTGAGSFENSSSVHTATEWVADYYYGSEAGNEIFFAFPSAFIAANYQTKGILFGRPTDDGWNDTWIWGKDGEGLPVNAAVTFLPGLAQVDPRNGSIYELDENNNPVPNEKRVDNLVHLMESEDFVNILKDLNNLHNNLLMHKSDRRLGVEEIRDLLRQFVGGDEELLNALAYSNTVDANLGGLLYADIVEHQKDTDGYKNYMKNGGMRSTVEGFLKNTKTYYNLAPNTINSKDYWEIFFEKNLSIKPNKIVYYSGLPENALNTWRRNVGLTNFPDVNQSEITREFPGEMADRKQAFRQMAIDALDLLSIPDEELIAMPT